MQRNNGRHRHDLTAVARRVMTERGLLPDFSPTVMREVARIQAVTADGDPVARDLRGLLWCSIDNDDSRDLDQLTVAEPMAGGAVRILVAIADVDAAVTQGSEIDGHARHNTTSVYTAAAIFPMLPERLSTDLTSLGEGDDRVALVVEMVVNDDGTLAASDLYRAVVHNRAKLAYNAVAAWIEGKGPIPERVAAVPGMEAQLRLQDQVAQRLRDVRHHHGALSLETVQARPVFDGDVLADLEVEETNRAKSLIEDFMIAANGVTARYLEAWGYTSLRRVLRSPARWERIVELAAGLGEGLPAEPTAGALEAFLAKRRRAARPRTRTRSCRSWPNTAPRRRIAPARSSDRWGNRPPRSCWSPGSGSGSTPSSRAPRIRGPGSASCGRPWRASWCTVPTAWTSATKCASS